MVRLPSVFLSASFLLGSWSNGQEICTSPNNEFNVKVNFSEGQLGYFEFEECEGTNPILGVKLGETYTFRQEDPSNWFHPMGFAYFADGALDDQPELEPGETPPGSTGDCSATNDCPSPKYNLDGDFLGVGVSDPADFGLDVYEPKFFLPILDWIGEGAFSIDLTFDVADIDQDFFYFCHIHQFMSGRIKVLAAADPFAPLVAENTPEIPYEYDEPGDFDRACNTFGLDAWQLPNELCPDRFVCGADDAPNDDHAQFAECIDAMNCDMMAGMTTNIGMNEVALFIYHMIPHHENAINMAKALLPRVPCDDLTDEDDPNCVMQVLVREIINTQNFQIQTMRGVNEAMGAPETDNCDVPVLSISCGPEDACGGSFSSVADGFRVQKKFLGVDLFCISQCVSEFETELRLRNGWDCGSCD